MPNNDWIVSVLNDLDAYAKTNGLTLLAEELTRVKLVAISEIGNGLLDPNPRSKKNDLPTKQH